MFGGIIAAGGGTVTGCTGTGGPLPADRRASSARLTTDSAGTLPAGTIARSTTRSSRISQGQRVSVTKSSGKTSYHGMGNGCRTVSVSNPSFTSLILRVP